MSLSQNEAMAWQLIIELGAYRLRQGDAGAWTELAVLPGGARTLLGQSMVLDEHHLESAIAMAEDWLMPHAAAMQGAVLQICDTTGRLRAGLLTVLQEPGLTWTLEAMEQVFLRMVDLATGRTPPEALQIQAAAMADLLVLRELAHHGKVSLIELA